MRVLIFSLLFFFSWNIYGQYFDSTSTWYEHYYGTGWGFPNLIYNTNYKYHFDGDTLINSINYYKLFATGTDSIYDTNTGLYTIVPFNNFKGYIREDTLSGKIYYKSTVSAFEDDIYDFTLGNNDTVMTNNYGIGVCQPLWINSVDTFYFNNQPRKKLNVAGNNNSGPNKIFEGIGGNSGFLGKLCLSWDSGVTCLLGYADLTDSIGFINCNLITSHEFSLNDPSILVTVSPNPVITDFNVVFKNVPIEQVSYSMKNIVGENIIDNKRPVNNQEILEMGNLDSGIYILVICIGQKRIIKKILKM